MPTLETGEPPINFRLRERIRNQVAAEMILAGWNIRTWKFLRVRDAKVAKLMKRAP